MGFVERIDFKILSTQHSLTRTDKIQNLTRSTYPMVPAFEVMFLIGRDHNKRGNKGNHGQFSEYFDSKWGQFSADDLSSRFLVQLFRKMYSFFNHKKVYCPPPIRKN